MSTCPNCHAQLEDDARFCDFCGTPVAASPVYKAEEPARPMTEVPAYEAPAAQPVAEVPAAAQPVTGFPAYEAPAAQPVTGFPAYKAEDPAYEAPAARPVTEVPAAAQPATEFPAYETLAAEDSATPAVQTVYCAHCGQPTASGSPFCPNCGKPLGETAFCPNCGKPASTSSALCPHCSSKLYDAAFCPNCGTPSNPEFSFCQNCGSPLREKSAGASGKSAKKAPKSKKGILFLGIGAIAAVLAVVVAFLFLGTGGLSSSKKLPNCALYIKDKEIFYNALSKKDPLQVTARLVDSGSIDSANLSSYAFIFENLCRFSKDGSLLFFPDKLDFSGSGFSLYYRPVGKPKEEAVKIDSGISGDYFVSDDASSITYLKDGTLYQYDRKKQDKQKIASDILSYYVSADGKDILFLNEENTLYSVVKGGDRNKVDSDVQELSHVSDDLSIIFYLKDETLYRKRANKDKEKVSSDVFSVICAYDSGEVYYLKSENTELSLKDFVVDDKKKDDESMKEPQYPNWNDPSYNAKYEAYQKAQQEFYGKQNRDYLRESLANRTLQQTNYTLCYDDGKKETNLVISESFSYDASYFTAVDAPVILYKEYDQENKPNVKLSEITDLWEVEQQVYAARTSNLTDFVAAGSASSSIDLDEAVNLRLSSDGKNLYYFTDVPEDKNYGELYRLPIASSGEPGKPELLDSDVYTEYMRFVGDEKLLYFKDFKNSKGELYLSGEKIDYDVSIYSINYNKNSGKVTYFTDWNDNKNYGTLKTYAKKEAVKISDDVHNYCVIPNGDVLYLYDYSTQYYRGDLYLWNSKKAEKIDDDVVCIIPIR